MTIIEQPSGIVSAYDEQILEVIDTAATSTGYVTAKVEYHNGDFHWKTLPAKVKPSIETPISLDLTCPICCGQPCKVTTVRARRVRSF